MGYQPDFIDGHTIPLPQISQRVRQNAFGGDFIHHSRHSLLFNQQRGLAYVSAHNIDGANILDQAQSNRDFEFGPKIQPETLQIGNDQGYKQNHWDRGHLARRKSVRWGNADDARKAELESDFYSNIVPQHTRLHHASWGKIEDWMLDKVEGDSSQKACVFTGPIFTPDDPHYDNQLGKPPIQIPAGFWKIFAAEHAGELKSAGFLVWQRDYDHEEPLPFDPVLEQVRLSTIEVLTGMVFPVLRPVDVLYFENVKKKKTQPAAPGDGPVGAGPVGAGPGMFDRLQQASAPMHTVIDDPADIVF